MNDTEKKEVEEKIKAHIAKQRQCDVSELKTETTFEQDLKCDSLDLVDLMMTLEEEFKITIPDEESEKMKTIGQVVEYITAKLEEGK